MAGLALSGLASGVDTAGIVDQLMAIERRSLTKLQLNQSRITARDSGLKDVQSKLSALKSAALALQAPDLWASKQTTESSMPTQVGVERISGSGTGGSSLKVLGLAGSAQRTYGFATSTAARTLEFTAGGVTTSLSAGANATLDEVVATVNARSDLPVFAAAVVPNGGGAPQLILSSRTTGLLSDFNLAQDGAPVASVSAKAGKDAQYLVDGAGDPDNSGLPFTSATNVVENAIPGLRLTFKAITADDVSITVGAPGLDKDAVKTKVTAFVEAYNAMVTTSRTKLAEKSVPTAASTSEATKGQLFGDSQLTSMLAGFRAAMGADFGADPDVLRTLRSIGISTGAPGAATGKDSDAVAGKLTIDSAALTKALETNPADLRKLFDGPTGVAKGIEALVKRHVGTTGALDARLKNSVDEQKRLTDAMTRTETRLAAKEKRLQAQFAAMESALQASQTQSAWLTGQLTALNAS